MRKKFLSLIVLSGAMLAGLANAAPLADGASKFLGNITTNGAVRSDFGTYWNQITAENECKWGSIEGTRGTYNFTGCKNAYDWAKNNGGHFKFHALVWGSQYPNWLKSLSATDTKTAITNWFDAVQKQFPDLEMIDVVNEAIRTSDGKYHSGYTDTQIIQALGGDNNGDYTFVTTAFKMARERWPNAILIYNDYNTFRWQINEGIALVNKIKAAGAPVDAYGQQAHDLTDMDATSFKAALKKIHDETDLPLFITEYDIGTDDDALQKQRYSEQIPEFWNAEYVAGITLWGYIYGSTWTTNGNSGIIKNGSDRPAMTWLKEYMAANKGVNTTGLLGSTGTIDTVPQAPYKDSIAIPGTVEAENYDVGGQSKSYYDADATNQGAVYREDRVDVVALTSGYAIGYTDAGEWLEYTVNVAKEGVYTYEALVSSGSDGSSFRLFIDDQAITDTVKVTNGGDWDTYSTVTGKTTALTAGPHILKIAITGSSVNIDNIKFTEGTTKLAEIKANLTQGSQGFKVYNVKGTYLGAFQASSISGLKTQIQKSNLNSGVYLVRNKNMSKFIEVKK
ncbi:MAG: endo-1,4-beta-xylanase [Fibrobacteraceae bacterium]